ncbi:MAG: DNA ligase, partial [Candidatus Aenigmarchaeota archaeon]|nr:DNA ligase [Candidatus Aenigmarchaeota archaeon]
MRFSEFAEACEELGGVPSKLKKTDIIAGLLKRSGDDLYMVATLLQGRVFPSFDEREVGIAAQSMEKIIAQATGFSSAEIRKRFSKIGDFGLVAEELVGKKKQRTLLSTPLSVRRVFENLRKVAEVEGRGSQER